jgi:serine O-acetyltransferase
VAACVAVVGIPAKAIQPHKKVGEFVAYGTPTGNVPDPVARALEAMSEQVNLLQQRLAALETQASEAQPNKIADHATLPHVVVDNDRPEKERVAAGRKSDC